VLNRAKFLFATPIARPVARTAGTSLAQQPPQQSSKHEQAQQKSQDPWVEARGHLRNLSAQLSGFETADGRRRHQRDYLAAGLYSRLGHRRDLDQPDVSIAR